MSTKAQRKKEDHDVAGWVLFWLGLVAPIAGFVYGPGQWWQYLIWLAIGLVLIWAHAVVHPVSDGDRLARH